MALPPIASHRVVPYVLSGASGIHILVRMWRLSRMPASTSPLHLFLLKHTDVILLVSSSPLVVWHLTKRPEQRSSHSNPRPVQPIDTFLPQIAHQLRQVFTALLLGLQLIKRKAKAGRITEVSRLAERLKNVVYEGVAAVNELDPPDTFNGDELAREV